MSNEWWMTSPLKATAAAQGLTGEDCEDSDLHIAAGKWASEQVLRTHGTPNTSGYEDEYRMLFNRRLSELKMKS